MNRLLKLFFLVLSVTLLSSCQNYSDGRLLKKFISRFNAEEYACSATYVYPGDRMNIAFFAKEVKTLAPNAFIKLVDYHTEGKGDERYIRADLKWENATPALREYFNSIGYPIDSKGKQTVNLKIRDTNDGETISFIWGIPDVISDNLWIASPVKKDGKAVQEIDIFSEPNIKSDKIGTMEKDLIVGEELDGGWLPAYQVDKNGNIVKSYIQKSDGFNLDRTAYFSLGIFDSIGAIVALIIIIVIIVPIYYLSSTISGLFTNLPVIGPIICIVLIFAVIYVIYQLLEKILFELFIINLPY